MTHRAKLMRWSAELLHSVCMSALCVWKVIVFTLPFARPAFCSLPLFPRVQSRSRFYLARSQEIKRCNKKGPFSIIISFIAFISWASVMFLSPYSALPGLWWVGGESIFLMGSVHTLSLPLAARARINIFPLLTDKYGESASKNWMNPKTTAKTSSSTPSLLYYLLCCDDPAESYGWRAEQSVKTRPNICGPMFPWLRPNLHDILKWSKFVKDENYSAVWAWRFALGIAQTNYKYKLFKI